MDEPVNGCACPACGAITPNTHEVGDNVFAKYKLHFYSASHWRLHVFRVLAHIVNINMTIMITFGLFQN